MKEEEWMLTSILNCNRADLYTKGVNLDSFQKSRLETMKSRRQVGEPLQYILGETEFFGLPFKVDPRVLIPRPETEILVESILHIAQKRLSKETLKVLDLGTGSGNIAISLANNLEKSFITAVDISEDVLKVAKYNAEKLGVSKKIEFVNADMEGFLKRSIFSKDSFDIIAANPPYIAQDKIDHLPADVRKEPWIALNGGKEGLDFYKIILEYGPDCLDRNGILALEIGDGQRDSILNLIQDRKDITYHIVKDYVETDRIIIFTQH